MYYNLAIDTKLELKNNVLISDTELILNMKVCYHIPLIDFML